MSAVPAAIGPTDVILATVVTGNFLLASLAWRSAERRSEKWGVGALAVSGTAAIGPTVVRLAGD